jgi:lysophospholipase L1-like esterase
MIKICRFVVFVIVAALSSTPGSAQELPDPLRFEEAIQRFEAADRTNPPPEGAIVLTGSSSIMFWNHDAPADLAPLTVIARGFGGSVMHDLLHYLDRVVLTYKPRAVLIYEGDNDTGRNNLPNDLIMTHVHQGIERIHAQSPDTRIYLLTVKPSVARVATWPAASELNQRYRALAASDPRIHLIDVATPFLDASGKVLTDIFVEDNLHLNAKGYAIWAATIREVLMAHEAQYE